MKYMSETKLLIKNINHETESPQCNLFNLLNVTYLQCNVGVVDLIFDIFCRFMNADWKIETSLKRRMRRELGTKGRQEFIQTYCLIL